MIICQKKLAIDVFLALFYKLFIIWLAVRILDNHMDRVKLSNNFLSKFYEIARVSNWQGQFENFENISGIDHTFYENQLRLLMFII
jgi:hypothetical protein